MGVEQILVIIWLMINAVFGIVFHGEQRKFHAGYTLLGVAIWAALLYWGGFWSQ